MKFKSVLAVLGLLAIVSFPSQSHALDQLLLPEAGVSPVEAQITEFTGDAPVIVVASNENSVRPCDTMLKSEYKTTSDRIRAIKAYRQCRADHALQQLAVWRWQESETLNQN